jgi:mono/diheme cytochrome c family protein
MDRTVRVILALAIAAGLAVVVVACGSGDSSTPAATASSAAPAPTSAAPEPTAAQSSVPGGPSNSELAQLYAENCSGCHGADGSGGSAPSLLGEDDLGEVRAQIENGGGPMPAFSDKLQPGQIAYLAQYVVNGLPK